MGNSVTTFISNRTSCLFLSKNKRKSDAAAVAYEAGTLSSAPAPCDCQATGIERLKAEHSALQAMAPSYLVWISELRQPTMSCDEEGELRKCQADGPWEFTASISGSASTSFQAYKGPFRVTMRFTDKWPLTPPYIRFRCIFHHAMVDDEDSAMLVPFYANLQKKYLEGGSNGPEGKEAAGYTLAGVVDEVHNFLADPLNSWGISQNGGVPPRLSMMLNQTTSMMAKRQEVMDKFAKMVKHPDLFQHRKPGLPLELPEEWFDPQFWQAAKLGTEEAWRAILREELPDKAYSLPVFRLDFCEKLLEEIFNFYASGLPARRPNSMNNYGIIFNEIGLEPFVDALQEKLQPLGRILFPGAGEEWDGHHCFIVRYREGEDLGLDMHTDDSDVTFNICLGLDFEGAGLQFCGYMGAADHRRHSHTFQHVKGRCIVHPGRLRHGADDISRGERLNLILWNQSTAYRKSNEYKRPAILKENGPPDAVCVSYTHDRDFGLFKEYPTGKENFKGRGWCPPKHAEYDGFKQDAPSRGGG
eukprot:gnl/MRDRNA2_/MRDRNA2_101012_c0_seq1.p1 gnl/MRDRNA2_/MRDRNA2_101012_c0~~gnl/MRDRNA2_/MRDRNA2_101012_c0_seq1.p1  ORF type:complete len:529 (-),score=98.50 gnl/MRDRNA2_/MRDRNA2_101012_c0_seq1:206-1792(-)